MASQSTPGAHMTAALSLLDPANADFTAVGSGDWSDPATWQGGRVPTGGADVYVPQGVAVRFDAQLQQSLGVVRVDGTLDVATDVDTRLPLDTLVTAQGSRLTVGTAAQPVEAGVKAEIVIADNGAIDLAADPQMLGRGVVAMGEVEIRGAQKEPYLAVHSAPMSGDSEISVSGDASGWKVGDTVVVMGTHWVGKGSDGVLRTQDETRQIVDIQPGQNGASAKLVLDQALQYDHDAPAGHNLDVYVGNETRNVLFTSENPDGVRGHFMVMHSQDADIRYAEFAELGRTDKSLPLNVNGNIEARYPLHLHETGADAGANMSILAGNSVHGGPGWGIVQHSSAAAVDYNFVHDIVGAGIVSEDGNETGQWIGNFVTNIPGAGENFTIARDELAADFGHSGVAYENQSRLIVQQDNIAANASTGWMFRAAVVSVDDPDRDAVPFKPMPIDPRIDNEEAQILAFKGNEAAAVDVAFDSGHRQQASRSTDLRSELTDFKAWEVGKAVSLFNYTSEYVFKDGLFIGRPGADYAAGLPSKQEGTSFIGTHFENFRVGISDGGINHDGVYVDVTFSNVGVPLRTSGNQSFLDSADLTPLNKPVLTLDPASDLVLDATNRSIKIMGDLTDSVGTIRFGDNLWTSGGNPAAIRTGVDSLDGHHGSASSTEMVSLNGAMRKDGGWVMPLVFWVTDRFTAQHHPMLVEIKLQGFDEGFLTQHEITNFQLPDNAVQVIDVRAGETGSTTGGTGSTTNGSGSTADGSGSNTGGSGSTTNGSGSTSDGTGSTADGTDTQPTAPAPDAGTGAGTAPETAPETGTETDAPAGTETEAAPETEAEADAETGVETAPETGTDAETPDEPETETSRETRTEADAETGAEMVPEAAPETGTETDAPAGTETEAASGTEAEADAETGVETAPETAPETGMETESPDETETEAASGTEAEADPETGVETAPETGTDAETPAEPETETVAEPETDAAPEDEPRAPDADAAEAPAETAADGRLEFGMVGTGESGNGEWRSVAFSAPVEDAVVVAGPLSSNGGQSAHVRVRNVTDDGFEFRIEEWDHLDGRHLPETFSWMAATAGEHQLDDGRRISAGRLELVDEDIARVDFGDPLDDAVVFAQVSSADDEAAVAARAGSVTASGFQLGMQEEEAADGLHAAETAGWIALESGEGTDLQVARLDQGVDEDAFRFETGVDSETPLLAAMQSRLGNDASHLRFSDRDDAGVSVSVQEETSRDGETHHLEETVGWATADADAFDLFLFG